VPLKVRCFSWRAMLGRIPFNELLASRGVNIPSTLWVLCNLENESVDHLLLHCNYAKTVQEWVFKWCGIKLWDFANIRDFTDFKWCVFGSHETTRFSKTFIPLLQKWQITWSYSLIPGVLTELLLGVDPELNGVALLYLIFLPILCNCSTTTFFFFVLLLLIHF